MQQLTPKEEAIQLVNMFGAEIYNVDAVDGGGWSNCRLVDKSVNQTAKECAIICIEKLIGTLAEINNNESYNVSKYAIRCQLIKQEISKL